MRPFTAQAFRDLIAHRRAPAISLYQPTHRAFPDSRQNPVLYRDLIRRAEDLVRPSCTGRDGASRWTAALEKLLAPEFWAHPLDGLAVFVGPDVEVFYRLPRRVPELVVVGESFFTKPMMPFLRMNRRFYVLALSQNRVSLYAGDPFGLEPVGLPGMPHSISEALGDELKPDHVSLHSTGAGRGATVFTGQGAGADDAKSDLERYFRAIDRGLRSLLEGEQAPVVLAAVSYYHPIFRAVSRLPNLSDTSLVGNFDQKTPREIHAAAWQAILPELGAIEDRVLALHERLAGMGRASSDVGAIAKAAIAGRIHHLLLEEGARVEGRLNRETGRIEEAGADDGDVLDDIAEEALLRGADVMVLPSRRIPGGGPAVAAYRW
jgi:hypothetical protein